MCGAMECFFGRSCHLLKDPTGIGVTMRWVHVAYDWLRVTSIIAWESQFDGYLWVRLSVRLKQTRYLQCCVCLFVCVMLDFLGTFCCGRGRLGGLMVTVLDYGLSGSGSSPGRGHCVVFLGKTLYSHSASLHPGVQKDTGQINAEGSPAMNCMSAFHPEGISLVV